MRNFVAALAVFLAFLSGLTVFYIRHQVGVEAEEIQRLTRQIEQDKKSIHVLKTELAYLTSPAQLQELSSTYLGMMPPRATQILVSLSDVPLRKDASLRLVAFELREKKEPVLVTASIQNEINKKRSEGSGR